MGRLESEITNNFSVFLTVAEEGVDLLGLLNLNEFSRDAGQTAGKYSSFKGLTVSWTKAASRVCPVLAKTPGPLNGSLPTNVIQGSQTVEENGSW